MGLDVQSGVLERCLDAIYDAAVAPDGWRPALAALRQVFHAGFIDVCSWTRDRAQVAGLQDGLDERDYEDVFLGCWFNRNVWSQTKPVRMAGEVLSTRQMMPREELTRSAMYHEYLQVRGLHEGLRLALWVDDGSLGDLSMLRPWSHGAFGPAEVELGQVLLPHLQRAAAVTRRLREAEFQLDLRSTDDPAGAMVAIAFDRAGVPCWHNAAAEAMLARGDPLTRVGPSLLGLAPDVTARLQVAVARASGQMSGLRTGGTVILPQGRGSGAVTAMVQPVSRRAEWAMVRPAAALLLMPDPRAQAVAAGALKSLFGLTTAEAQLAQHLLDGATVGDVALRTGRSRNTLRSHLARLMQKTGTNRQVDLVRLLGAVGTTRTGSPVDPFRRPRTARPIRPA